MARRLVSGRILCMPAYRPYLLPLLDSRYQSSIENEPVTALEEEAAINSLCHPSRPSWEEIADRVRCAYGLEFLLEIKTHGVREVRKFLNQDGSACITLNVSVGEKAYCLMSHPDHLPFFDNYSDEAHQPVLVKPSLFSLLSNGAAHDPPLKCLQVHTHDSSSAAAFQDFLLRLTRNSHPSDWHLEPGFDCYSSRLRIHGQLTEAEPVSLKQGQWIIQSAISQCGLSANAANQLLEGSFQIAAEESRSIEARMSLIPSRAGSALVLRFLYPDAGARTLADIGVSACDIDKLKEVYTKGEGLWLVAGPTGCGKTTTLHALLQWCVQDHEKILAIEDPVEQVIPGVQHIQVARNRGLDFARAVRAFLRQSPDTILIGEIRDVETAGIAMQSARTGHRVLSTLHARNTAGVIRRFTDLEQEKQDLDSVCDILIHQRLLPLVCPDCRFEHNLDPAILQMAEALNLDLPERVVLGLGCMNCRSGYSTRTAVFSTGTIHENMDSDRGLLKAVWHHLVEGKTDFRAVQPFLPAHIRQHFTLCQV